MGEKNVKGDARRYSGAGGIAEAGGIIPWLIIKIVQWATRRLRNQDLNRNKKGLNLQSHW